MPTHTTQLLASDDLSYIVELLTILNREGAPVELSGTISVDHEGYHLGTIEFADTDWYFMAGR